MTNDGSYIPNPEGKGFVSSAEEKLQQKADKIKRLGIIEKIINEDGFKSIQELGRKLDEDYNISVSRQCLYKDLDELNRQGKHYKRTALSILASYRAKLNKINDLISKEDDPRELRSLYKLWSQMAKDYANVASKLGAHLDGKYQSVEKNNEPIQISFEDE
jgi:hypothetical protein